MRCECSYTIHETRYKVAYRSASLTRICLLIGPYGRREGAVFN